MPSNINLLPKDLGSNKKQSKSLALAKKISYGSIAIFVCVFAIGIGLNIFIFQNVSGIEKEQDELKQSITSLEETEYKLILTKDRIAKIQQILAARTAEEYYASQKELTDTLPETITVELLKIDGQKSLLQLNAVSSRDLVAFVETISSFENIHVVVMDELKFNPGKGYTIVLEIT